MSTSAYFSSMMRLITCGVAHVYVLCGDLFLVYSNDIICMHCLYYSTVTRIYFVLAPVYMTYMILPIRSWLNCVCVHVGPNVVLHRVAANTFLGILIYDK